MPISTCLWTLQRALVTDLEIISTLSPIAGYVCVQCVQPLLLAAHVCLAERSSSLNSNFLGLISYIGIVVYLSSLSAIKKNYQTMALQSGWVPTLFQICVILHCVNQIWPSTLPQYFQTPVTLGSKLLPSYASQLSSLPTVWTALIVSAHPNFICPAEIDLWFVSAISLPGPHCSLLTSPSSRSLS